MRSVASRRLNFETISLWRRYCFEAPYRVKVTFEQQIIFFSHVPGNSKTLHELAFTRSAHGATAPSTKAVSWRTPSTKRKQRAESLSVSPVQSKLSPSEHLPGCKRRGRSTRSLTLCYDRPCRCLSVTRKRTIPEAAEECTMYIPGGRVKSACEPCRISKDKYVKSTFYELLGIA